jgi:SET domain-containing protein
MFCMIRERRPTYTVYKVRAKRSTAGLGLFAEEAIPKGVKIIEYVGRIMIDEPDEKKSLRYIFTVDRHMDVDGVPTWNTARYANHSCRPNAEAYTYAKRIWIRSMRKIALGEEITYGYGEEYFDEHLSKGRCRCKKCTEQRRKE